MQNKLPQGWVECQFSDCIDKISISNKLKQKEYLLEGEYPVIDQGHFFISGYYNERNLLLEIGQPVIIFGDHTRCFKYVDFPFIAGADGIKVLKPKQFFNSKLFYYFCLALKFPNKGYSRHYQYLEKTIMHIPPLNEQRRIVEKIESEFAKIDEGLEHLQQAKEQIKQYRQSVLKSAFNGKLTQQNHDDESVESLLQKINTKANFNHNDKLPQGWVECQFSDCIDKISISNKLKQKEYLLEGEYPVIDQGHFFISGYYNERNLLLEIGQPVIIFGDHTRCFKYVDFPFIAGADGIKVLKPKQFFNSKLFYYFCLALKFPNKGYSRHYQYLEKTIMHIPPLNEQRRIVEEIEKRFAVADEVEKVVEENIEKAKQLKQSILKKAFEGRLVPQDPTDELASILLEKIKKERNKK